MTVKTVGFIGMGMMGSRMAPRIASAGRPVHVYDVRADAASAVARAHNGIIAENSPKAVAEAADAVITMLPAGPNVNEAVFGPNGLAEGFSAGDILIDMSSSQPWLTLDLAAALKKREIQLIDSPVSGGIEGAEAGTLTLMVGGADEAVERCMPVFESMARHIFRTGDVGSGHAVKTLNNMLSAMNTIAATEILIIGKRFGLDPAIMVDVINQSTGMNSAMQRNMKQQVLNRKFDAGFAWDLKFKDFGIAMELAQQTKTPVPVCGLGFQLFQAAQQWMGDTQGKTSLEIVRWIEHVAQTELRNDD